jgi:hypothetical protein
MDRPDPVQAAPLQRWTNPWLWMLAGLGLCLAAFLMARLAGGEPEALRVGLVAAGVLAAGIAVALRLTSRRPVIDALPPAQRRQVLTLLGLVIAAMAAGVIVLLVMHSSGMDMPFVTSTVVWMCILVVPIAGAVAFVCLVRTGPRTAFRREHEAAALLVVAATAATVGCWGLYLGEEQANDWYSMRIFLATLALAALVGAPLALLPMAARRAVISLLIVVHFVGISCAILSVPPAPWLVSQLWMRFYRPYLQFMFLNNAYQFYAPDPGPSNFFWYRIEYKDRENEKLRYWRWVKVPAFNEYGAPDYPLNLQYTRRLAMADQMAFRDNTTPPWFVTGKDGQTPVINPIYFWRIYYSGAGRERLLGDAPLRERPQGQLEIPFHPDVNPWTSQYRLPNKNAQDLIASSARAMAREPHPQHPDAEVVQVKVYHVVHQWPMPQQILRRMDPNNPILFHPYYQGAYDRDGKLLDAPVFDPDGNLISGDPFLHWMMPILCDDVNDPDNTSVYAHVFRHAGDDNWFRPRGQSAWQPLDLKGKNKAR